MTDQPQLPPPDTSLSDVHAEQSLIDGNVLCGAAYGVHFTLFVQCFSLLIRRHEKEKRKWHLLAYICVAFILGTIGFASELKFGELTFIQGRELPGGPLEYNAVMYSDKLSVTSNAAFVVCNWLSDGLLIYRLYMIWNDYWIVVLLPALMLVASFITSSLLLVQLSQPGSNLATASSINLGLAYWPISISINVVVTALIVGRLLYFRNKVQLALSPEHSRMYTSVASMIVESAALYTVVGIMFIVSYATTSIAENVLLPILGEVQAISPLLIILRVAQGQAWTRETVRTAVFTTPAMTFNRSNGRSTSGTVITGAVSRIRFQSVSPSHEDSDQVHEIDHSSLELGEKPTSPQQAMATQEL